ncbi:MAG: hypothetical protein R3316_12705, partial [Rhodovibrionaceae bacterium]|nr:hypothetical protein [Rhodovibrionaceae bacterium]
MNRMRTLLLVVGCALVATGCMSPKGDDATQKRAAVHEMRSDTLAKLYAIEPYAQTRIKESVGYAVFSNVGVNLLLLSTGSGYGVVKD